MEVQDMLLVFVSQMLMTFDVRIMYAYMSALKGHGQETVHLKA